MPDQGRALGLEPSATAADGPSLRLIELVQRVGALEGAPKPTSGVESNGAILLTDVPPRVAHVLHSRAVPDKGHGLGLEPSVSAAGESIHISVVGIVVAAELAAVRAAVRRA